MGDWDLPKLGWILLDTNFLIDFYSKQELYIPVFEKLRSNDNSIVSLDFVRTEFIRSKTKEVVRAKSEFFRRVVENLLPLDSETQMLVQATIESYGLDIDGVDLTDIYLACVVQRYESVYLLSRNHKDFPSKLFLRTCIFNVELDKDIKTYALYQYRQKDNKHEIITSPLHG